MERYYWRDAPRQYRSPVGAIRSAWRLRSSIFPVILGMGIRRGIIGPDRHPARTLFSIREMNTDISNLSVEPSGNRCPNRYLWPGPGPERRWPRDDSNPAACRLAQNHW